MSKHPNTFKVNCECGGRRVATPSGLLICSFCERGMDLSSVKSVPADRAVWDVRIDRP